MVIATASLPVGNVITPPDLNSTLGSDVAGPAWITRTVIETESAEACAGMHTAAKIATGKQRLNIK
jgi:hypothetical protein